MVAEVSDRNDNTRFNNMVKDRLKDLVGGTRGLVAEQEPFVLRLGDGLRQVWSDAAELSAKAGRMVDGMAGESVADAVQELGRSLDALDNVCSGAEGLESLRYLDEILSVASSLDNYLNEFKRIVRTLQILGMTTRIESARLGSEGRGFSTLADDVEKLAFNIVAHSSQIRDKYSALESVVHEASEKTLNIIQLQSVCASEAMGDIKSNLSALEKFLAESSSRATEFAGTSAGISTRVGEAVSSMQFHDIVRQRVEHVEEAFADMGQELDGLNGESMKSLAAWMVSLCRLQARQLEESGESFYSAIEGIKDNLLGIGDVVDAMCGSMGQQQGRSGQTPLHLVEAGIERSMDGVRAYVGQESEIRTLMTSVVDIVRDMSAFVNDIEEVGSEIELIALNASVRAAHTGELGAALGVLAIEIQGLSARAREHTSGVASLLTKVSGLSDTLVEHAEGGRREKSMAVTIADLGRIVEKLSQTNSQTESESASLVEESRNLMRSIHKLTDKVSFHESMRGKLAGFSRKALELGDSIASVVPEYKTAHIPVHLKGKLDRYTMETERDAHRSVFGHEHEMQSGSQDGDIELFSDDMDDNIELF